MKEKMVKKSGKNWVIFFSQLGNTKPVYTHGIENMSKTYVQSVGLMPYSKLSTYSSSPRGTITHKTEFKDLFSKPKDEYDTYLENNDLKGPTKKFYW